MGINTGGWVGGNIADVISASSSAVQTAGLNAVQDFRAVLWLDGADLQIIARGDLNVSAGQFPCDGCRFPELMRSDDSTWNAQSAHVAVLHRIEPEQAIPLEAENIFGVMSVIGPGVHHQGFHGIQRVQFPLDPALLW